MPAQSFALTINKKINSALKQKLTVIFCIGETLAQKKRKETKLYSVPPNSCPTLYTYDLQSL